MFQRFTVPGFVGLGLALSGLFATSYHCYKKSFQLRLVDGIVPTPSKSEVERAFAIPAEKLASCKQNVDYVRLEFKTDTPKEFFSEFEEKWHGEKSYIVINEKADQDNLYNFEKIKHRRAGLVIRVYAEEKPSYIDLTTGFGVTLKSLKEFPLVDGSDDYVAILNDKELKKHILAVKPIGKTALIFNGDTFATPKEAKAVLAELEKHNITNSRINVLGPVNWDSLKQKHCLMVPSIIEFNNLIKTKLAVTADNELHHSESLVP